MFLSLVYFRRPPPRRLISDIRHCHCEGMPVALAMPILFRDRHAKVNDVLSNHYTTLEDFDNRVMEMAGSRSKRDGRIAFGSYHSNAPMIRPSRLTTIELGGIGKNLSEGWCLNYAIGCTHGCPFCYVDSIQKRFGPSRYGEMVRKKWGDYFLTPSNLKEVIAETNWSRWNGKEVMLSSTHDPYLPELKDSTREILGKALPYGVRFCIQTRSHNVMRDFKLLSEFKDQIRIQVSIATSDKKLGSLIEPRVPSLEKRIEVLKKAKDQGIDIGVIIAPILPPLKLRPDLESDIKNLTEILSEVKPDYIFAESLHLRGGNYQLLEDALGEPIIKMNDFDGNVGRLFKTTMNKVGLKPVWWSDHSQSQSNIPKLCGTSIPKSPIGVKADMNRGSGKCRSVMNQTGTGLRSISEL